MSSLSSPPEEDASLSPLDDGKREAKDEASKAPPRKRRRVVISCTECHRRKQKCDRQLPCANCVSRGKQDVCRYETGAPTLKDQRKRGSTNGDRRSSEEEEEEDSLPNKVANFGYSATGASTLGFLKKIDEGNPKESLSRLNPDPNQQGDHFNTRERYKSLIRQLPAKTYIEKLVNIYFTEFNFQYHSLDRDVFDKQLAEWFSLPYGALMTGPQALSPDLRAFPALLFQVLATALLALPSGSDPDFDGLKFAGTMSFEDLALDYSESGMAILSLLGKRQMSLNTVLTDFLRAAFLKYVALVTEAWHAIGNAIRDAQEIGLHRDALDPKPKSHDPETIIANQWEIERRRRLWVTLVGWDSHTGVVLGRPLTIVTDVSPTLPVDAPVPKDRSKTPVAPRTESDPPTPLTRSLWANKIMMMLREVVALEKEGPCPKDFSKVDELYDRMKMLEDQTPPYFRLQNPDMRYDNLPECYWIKSVRSSLPQLWSFNFMAISRPYIFTRAKSRSIALHASLAMLETQRQQFAELSPAHYKTFSLFFGTFDAIVLMASIYILFPTEHLDLLPRARQHFQWAVERFQAMSERNTLAKSALGVLHAIRIRLQKAMGIAPGGALPSTNGATAAAITQGTTNGPTNGSAAGDTPASGLTPAPGDTSSPRASESLSAGTATATNSVSGPSTVGSTATFTPQSLSSASDAYATSEQLQPQLPQQQFDWAMSAIDWASLQPIYPTGDLVYNDLNIRDVDGGSGGAMQASSSSSGAAHYPLFGSSSLEDTSGGGWGDIIDTQSLNFDGDFGNDSLWSVLNQYSNTFGGTVGNGV